MIIPILNDNELFEKLTRQTHPSFGEYHAFYSSWFGGIVKNPQMMLLPVDDHMVHRGDGVFEAIKAVGRAVYMLDEHLQRLFHSAQQIALKLSFDLETIQNIILDTLRAANQNDAIIRVFMSRGPGNFTANPYDTIDTQLYVAVTGLQAPPSAKYDKGAIIGKSNVPSNTSWLAQVKSCNYLPNVLMKKEAIDRQLDFVISMDEEGYIMEGATENIMIINKDGHLVHPPLKNILKGTTMIRTAQLAEEQGITAKVTPISLEDLYSAKEVIVTGTTVNIMPIIAFENHIIGDGKPGPIAKKLMALLQNDIKNGKKSTFF